jgi:transglutaminase-like putative cysteine protease
MRYQIQHTTRYDYSAPVQLQPHVVRLQPRSGGGWQTLEQFSLVVTPVPMGRSDLLDLEGNTLVKLWFDGGQLVESLDIQVQSQVTTHQANPFNYLLEPWALDLPLDLPSSLSQQLQPYLGGPIDAVAQALAQEIAAATGGYVPAFLNQLNQQIYTSCQYLIRETGDPLPAGLTWTEKKGSCRDFTVLFMAACRAVGLAARFVSGYQKDDPADVDSAVDPDHADIEHHLHAWAEVYCPGAGWRGYDPTLGLVVADRHIPLVASVDPRYAAPVTGKVSRAGGVQSVLTSHLDIQVLPTGAA